MSDNSNNNSYSDYSILILEDDVVFRKYLANVIHTFFKGKIFETSSPVMALDIIQKEKPQLLILDLELPEMDGRATLIRIRNNSEIKELPVLVCSGISYEDLVLDLIKLDIIGYLVKPIKSRNLINKIKTILDSLSQNGQNN